MLMSVEYFVPPDRPVERPLAHAGSRLLGLGAENGDRKNCRDRNGSLLIGAFLSILAHFKTSRALLVWFASALA